MYKIWYSLSIFLNAIRWGVICTDGETLAISSMDICCEKGEELGVDLMQSCDNFTVPIKDVIPEMQHLCITTVEVCCTKARREVYCGKGKEAALAGKECSLPEQKARFGAEAYNDCCLACTLGVIVASMAQRCDGVGSNFGHPWETPFEDCCKEYLVPGDITIEPTPPDPTEGETKVSTTQEVTESTTTAETTDITERCPEGYQYNSIFHVCDDIDECADDDDICEDGSICQNTIGSFFCSSESRENTNSSEVDLGEDCPPGYQFFLISCIDINECLEKSTVCGEQETCVNTEGSFKCEPQEIFKDSVDCPPGFILKNGSCHDVNECQTGEHNCMDSQRCDNTIGSYVCVRHVACGTGYTLNFDSGKCEDVNECSIGTHNCDALGPAYLCRNIQGSFRCERKRCNIGEILDENGLCTRLTCGAGFEPGPLGNCMDLDECAGGDACPPGAECINTMGSYECVSTCEIGLRLNQALGRCEDVDECSTGTAQCFHGSSCVNTIGSYRCVCPAGYEMHLGMCQDIDECMMNGRHLCGVDSECQNMEGSYRCICKQGFKYHGKKCVDVNECKEIPDVCQHHCINLWGSYRCQCEAGFRLSRDQRSCTDIDECQDAGRCMGNCVNEPGSYRCTCPHGYSLSSNGQFCEDEDECQDSTRNTCPGEDNYCHNTRGSYKCNDVSCPRGYTKEPGHLNRCKRISNRCRATDLNCLRQPISISYNFISIINNLQIDGNGLDIFTMQSAKYDAITTKFTLTIPSAQASAGVRRASRSSFRLKTGVHQATVALASTIHGPQDVELELMMEMYYRGRFSGAAKAKIFIFVGGYEY